MYPEFLPAAGTRELQSSGTRLCHPCEAECNPDQSKNLPASAQRGAPSFGCRGHNPLSSLRIPAGWKWEGLSFAGRGVRGGEDLLSPPPPPDPFTQNLPRLQQEGTSPTPCLCSSWFSLCQQHFVTDALGVSAVAGRAAELGGASRHLCHQ